MPKAQIILLGPPGAGKGTQAKSLSEELSLAHISTGDILRRAIKNNTPLGREAKKYVDAGELVPDGLVTKMVVERLGCADAKEGFILDGFPRTIQQAEALDNFLKSARPVDYTAMYLNATEKTIIQRLSGRRICRKCQAVFHLTNMPPRQDMTCDFCKGELYQREDDAEETIKNRLVVYMQQTSPVVEYYARQKKLVRIDADKEAGVVLREMLNAL